jgi:molybdate transport system regulatory protein
VRLSARNQLAGTVTAVDHGVVTSTVTIELPGGQSIVSSITRASAENLELAPGDSVVAVVKASEVIVGKD